MARTKVRSADRNRGVALVQARRGDVEVPLAALTVDDTMRPGRLAILRDVAMKLGWIVPPSQYPALRRIPVGKAWILSVGDRQQVWSAGNAKKPGVKDLGACSDDVAGHVAAARAIWWSLAETAR
ncbi:MAG: hypothetical protein H6732_02915 [Alphaproteobacteria bacterium]|nr:hypothetical protein [Alphaproteobacteria bacterium]